MKRWNRQTNTIVTTAEKEVLESNIGMEEIASFCEEITRHFGENAIWASLFLLLQLDKNGKFPSYLRIGMYDELMDFIENSEVVQKAFGRPEKV